MPLRLLPLLFFLAFTAVAVATEQIGQRIYDPVATYGGVFSKIFFPSIVILGLLTCDRYAWWAGLLVWPISLLYLGVSTLVMIIGLNSGIDENLNIYSETEIYLTILQAILLSAALVCLLLPSIRANFTTSIAEYSYAGWILTSVVVAWFWLFGGVGVVRAGAIGLAIGKELTAPEVAHAPAGIAGDGTLVDLAVPAAAVYRVARHAFAAEAALWHSLEILEAGTAGARVRDEAVRDASATVLLARHEVEATFVAIAALEQSVPGHFSARDLADMTAGLEAWAGAAEHAADLAASTVPLIAADEAAPGNITYGMVPTMMRLQDARAQAIEQLGSLIPAAMLEGVLIQHFVAVSAALGDIAKLVPAFVDRQGATADLEATAETIWSRTVARLSPTHQAVRGLASSFQRREGEIRESIGFPLMEDAFVPVISSYEAAGGALALEPTNAFIGLRARLLEAAQLGKRPEAMIVPLLRSARQALLAVAKQAELGETRMGYFLDAVGEAGV